METLKNVNNWNSCNRCNHCKHCNNWKLKTENSKLKTVH